MGVEVVVDSTVAGGFKIQGAGGSALAGVEKGYAAAIGRIMRALASDAKDDPTGADPKAQAERNLRSSDRLALVRELRAEADLVAAGQLDADIAIDNAFVRKGMYAESLSRRSSKLFQVYEETDGNGIPTDVLISVSSESALGVTTPTEDQQKLFVAIEAARTVVSAVAARIEKGDTGLFAPKAMEARQKERADAIRKRYIRNLGEIARVGLEGVHPQLAKLALETFKAEFVASEAGRIKNGYVLALGKAAAIATLIALAAHFALVLFLEWSHPLFRYRVFFAAAAGAAVGTWLSFSIRRVSLTFEELAVIEEDLLDPSLRILFVILLTTVLLLLFWTGVMNIELGALKTGDLGKPQTPLPMGAIAFLIGAFCGMAERALATAMSGRAAAFVRTLST